MAVEGRKRYEHSRFQFLMTNAGCWLPNRRKHFTFISNLEPRADKYEIIRILRKRYANELYLIIIINDINVNWSFQQWYCTVSVISFINVALIWYYNHIIFIVLQSYQVFQKIYITDTSLPYEKEFFWGCLLLCKPYI